MKYYTIVKNNEIIGIGNTNDITIPKNDPLYKYKEITKEQYELTNKKEYTPKDN